MRAGAGRADWRTRGRRARALLLLLAAAAAPVLAAGGCGFEPLYGRGRGPGGEVSEGAAPVRAELAAIRIAGLDDGRLGQILRNDLIDRLNPAGIGVPPEYVLLVRLRRETRALAVQLDNTATRFDLTLAAAFQLRRLTEDDGQPPLYRSLVRRVASYDVRRQPFATLIAERDAERRAARAVSEDIATQLAVLFARGVPEADAPELDVPEPAGADLPAEAVE